MLLLKLPRLNFNTFIFGGDGLLIFLGLLRFLGFVVIQFDKLSSNVGLGPLCRIGLDRAGLDLCA